MLMDPPRFLQPGDVVRCEIEGSGAHRAPHRRSLSLGARGARARAGEPRRPEVVGEGPLVLLVPSASPDSRAPWRNQIGPLAEAGPAGDRARPAGLRRVRRRPEGVDAYRVMTVVADLVAVLDALGAEQADVVGHDLGAAILVGAGGPAPLDRVRSPPRCRSATERGPPADARSAREGLAPAAVPVRGGRGAAAARRRRAAARVAGRRGRRRALSRRPLATGALTVGTEPLPARTCSRGARSSGGRCLRWRLRRWASGAAGDPYLVEDQMRGSRRARHRPVALRTSRRRRARTQLDAPEAVTELLLSHL